MADTQPPAPAEDVPEQPKEENDEQVVEEVEVKPLDPPCMDLTDYKPKVDHFDHIHALADQGKVDGAPNFRQVENNKIF